MFTIRLTFKLHLFSRHKYVTNMPLFCSYMLKSRLKYAGLRHLRRTLSKTHHNCPRKSPVNDVRSRASTRTSRPFYVAVSRQRPKERPNDNRKTERSATKRETERAIERPNERKIERKKERLIAWKFRCCVSLQIHGKICQKHVSVLLTDVQITSLFTSQIRHKHAFVLQLYVQITFKISCSSSLMPNLVKNTPQLPRKSPVNDVRSRASSLKTRWRCHFFYAEHT